MKPAQICAQSAAIVVPDEESTESEVEEKGVEEEHRRKRKVSQYEQKEPSRQRDSERVDSLDTKGEAAMTRQAERKRKADEQASRQLAERL